MGSNNMRNDYLKCKLYCRFCLSPDMNTEHIIVTLIMGTRSDHSDQILSVL